MPTEMLHRVQRRGSSRRRNSKKEEASINACRTGPFPITLDKASEDKPQASDLPFDLEDGDPVWATGLLPEAQYIKASSTLSQRLVESFSRHTESNPVLPTSGRGLKDPLPDYIKMFGQSLL